MISFSFSSRCMLGKSNGSDFGGKLILQFVHVYTVPPVNRVKSPQTPRPRHVWVYQVTPRAMGTENTEVSKYLCNML
jgi:hypothetical protein